MTVISSTIVNVSWEVSIIYNCIHMHKIIVCMHVTYANAHTRADAHPHTHTYTHTYTHIHICTHTNIHMHIHARTHVNTHTCTHTYTRTHIYTHTHTHSVNRKAKFLTQNLNLQRMRLLCKNIVSTCYVHKYQHVYLAVFLYC